MLSAEKKNSYKLISVFCFAFLMYIDKVVGTESQYIWLITNNLVGVVIAFLIMSSFSVREFLKPFYLVYSALGLVGVIGGIAFWYTHQVGHLFAWWATVPINVWLLGMIVFKYIEKIIIKKEMKIAFAKWEYVFIACMLLMLLSGSDSVWPLYYLIVFELLWHAPFSKDQKSEIFVGMLDGVILGFVLLTVYAFFYTPYTQVRYRGAYWNCNRNACMYMLAFAAILTKLYMIKDSKGIRKIVLICLSVTSVGLTLYTGCRTAVLGIAFIICFYCIAIERRIIKNKWRTIVLKCIAFGALVLLSVPLLYFPMRYLQEAKGRIGAAVKTVLTGDEVTYRLYGESYVNFDQAMSSVLFRFTRSDAETPESKTRVRSRELVQDTESLSEHNTIESLEDRYTIKYSFANYPERGIYSFTAPKTFYTGIVSLDHRVNIYLVLIHNLNMTGHLDDELSIDIISDVPGSDDFRLNNAQNFVLHYLFTYGVPIGLLFLALFISEVIFLVKGVNNKRTESIAFLMFAITYLIMGLMEVVWVPGQLVLIVLFVAPFFLTDHGMTIKE